MRRPLQQSAAPKFALCRGAEVVRVTEPIAGMTVDSSDAPLHRHAGTSQYFCALQYGEKLRADPERYLSLPIAFHEVESYTERA